MVAKAAQEGAMSALSLLAKLKAAPASPLPSATPSAASPAATPSTASPAPAAKKPVTDTVSLSAQAVSKMNGSADTPVKPPVQLKIAGDFSFADLQAMNARLEKVMEYHSARRDFARDTIQSLRGQFGFDPEGKDGGNLMLSGEIGKVVERQMESRGLAIPEKSQVVKDWEAEMQSVPPEGWDTTSMITLFLPGSQGTDDKQVEIWLDDRALEKLGKMSADEVKVGLVDMLNGPDPAASQATVDNGAFGAAMRTDSKYHPEFQHSKARLGFFDPEQGTNAQPWLMIQSRSEPGYVQENAGKLVDTVMSILKEGAAGRTAG
ncbi:MAG TPA: hypothetical protein VD860_16825 [Azospirillum sp.]|nr:hypothetical protein [Azospirillum sp.]